MHCQRCGNKLTRPSASHLARGGFMWDHICQTCKDRFKLDDWNDACRPLGERDAIHQTE